LLTRRRSSSRSSIRASRPPRAAAARGGWGPGDWLIGWGGTETGAKSLGGVRHFSISFAGAVMYRLLPIAFGQLSRDVLRAAMDAQWSAGGAATTQEATSGGPLPFRPDG